MLGIPDSKKPKFGCLCFCERSVSPNKPLLGRGFPASRLVLVPARVTKPPAGSCLLPFECYRSAARISQPLPPRSQLLSVCWHLWAVCGQGTRGCRLSPAGRAGVSCRSQAPREEQGVAVMPAQQLLLPIPPSPWPPEPQPTFQRGWEWKLRR